MGKKRTVDESSLTAALPTKNSRQKKLMENDAKQEPSEDRKPADAADGRNMEESSGTETTLNAHRVKGPTEETAVEDKEHGPRVEPPFVEWLLPGEQRTDPPSLFFYARCYVSYQLPFRFRFHCL
jgi:hypothetical protein